MLQEQRRSLTGIRVPVPRTSVTPPLSIGWRNWRDLSRHCDRITALQKLAHDPSGSAQTKIVVMPEGSYWTAVIEGHPRKRFASKAAVWEFVLGIVSKELIAVKVLNTTGTVAAEITLNPSLQ